MELDLFELVDLAGPVVVLAMLLALLMVLWSLSILNLQVRLLQDRVDSLERDKEEFEEELEMLARRPPEHSAPPQPDRPASGLGDLLGAREAPSAEPKEAEAEKNDAPASP